ncbi:uncharacterized protein LOC130856069 isoform X1 [Hippopotamus amphibius kiboko]|uniref:uncharacterized protein LOC130856069 isoform X1 n=1 Tax=Hippopotamus amphibius kiboko TaxID=575201 RepID=UPI0025990AD2|nr:uncharacterized protein LOC130856069 isoform X1 [Hippopotamus amphibius kiboko]
MRVRRCKSRGRGHVRTLTPRARSSESTPSPPSWPRGVSAAAAPQEGRFGLIQGVKDRGAQVPAELSTPSGTSVCAANTGSVDTAWRTDRSQACRWANCYIFRCQIFPPSVPSTPWGWDPRPREGLGACWGRARRTLQTHSTTSSHTDNTHPAYMVTRTTPTPSTRSHGQHPPRRHGHTDSTHPADTVTRTAPTPSTWSHGQHPSRLRGHMDNTPPRLHSHPGHTWSTDPCSQPTSLWQRPCGVFAGRAVRAHLGRTGVLVAGDDRLPWVGVDAGPCRLPGQRLELALLRRACSGDSGAGVLPDPPFLCDCQLPGLPLPSGTRVHPTPILRPRPVHPRAGLQSLRQPPPANRDGHICALRVPYLQDRVQWRLLAVDQEKEDNGSRKEKGRGQEGTGTGHTA